MYVVSLCIHWGAVYARLHCHVRQSQGMCGAYWNLPPIDDNRHWAVGIIHVIMEAKPHRLTKCDLRFQAVRMVEESILIPSKG